MLDVTRPTGTQPVIPFDADRLDRLMEEQRGVLDQRAEDRDDLRGLVAVQDQRRQQADDALGGDADEEARFGRAAEQRRARTVELDAEHQALAADLDDAFDPGELALEP